MPPVRPPRLLAALLVGLLALPAMTAGSATVGGAGAPALPAAPTQDAAGCVASDPVPPLLLRAGLVSFTEDPAAGEWRSWLVAPSEVPVPPPPDVASATTGEELAELHLRAVDRKANDTLNALFWDDGGASAPWTELHLHLLIMHYAFASDAPSPSKGGVFRGPTRVSHELAVMQVALHDALVAAWAAKYCYLRPPPWALDPALRPVVDKRPVPSYPSEHAVVAGAAVEVLKAFYPCPNPPYECDEMPERLEEIARVAAESRLWGGGNYRSDVTAGMALGRAVAQRVLELRADDGSETPWSGQVPVGPCLWQPTPPAFSPRPRDPHWADVRPFLMPSPEAFRPAPPPACGSAAYVADHREVYERSQHLTEAEIVAVARWDQGFGFGQPSGAALWETLNFTQHGDLTTMATARALAHVAAAGADATIASWDAKMAYWSERPVTVVHRAWDPAWRPLLTTTPVPLDVTHHSATYRAMFRTAAHFLPAYAHLLEGMADEASASRLDSGIDTRRSIADGDALGARVAALAIARAQSSS